VKASVFKSNKVPDFITKKCQFLSAKKREKKLQIDWRKIIQSDQINNIKKNKKESFV
jgi:hypothetical protein